MKLKIITLSLLGFVNAAGLSQESPFSQIKEYKRADYNREVTLCDELAGHPSDPEKVAEGVTQEAMDKPAAITACLKAVKNDPENPRLNYQLARAYGYSGLHVESDTYRKKALNAGYPQSLFVLGYIRIEGWDGRGADPCYGGELVRRSAEAGRFAGLVGFPHYVMTGTFKNCDTYPKVDNEEIIRFLDEAEKKVADDYYHRILVKTLKTHFEKK